MHLLWRCQCGECLDEMYLIVMEAALTPCLHISLSYSSEERGSCNVWCSCSMTPICTVKQCSGSGPRCINCTGGLVISLQAQEARVQIQCISPRMHQAKCWLVFNLQGSQTCGMSWNIIIHLRTAHPRAEGCHDAKCIGPVDVECYRDILLGHTCRTVEFLTATPVAEIANRPLMWRSAVSKYDRVLTISLQGPANRSGFGRGPKIMLIVRKDVICTILSVP